MSGHIPTGSSQQYLGQEEYYSEQYSHGQGSAEAMSQQYYPDGKAAAGSSWLVCSSYPELCVLPGSILSPFRLSTLG